MKMYRFEHEGAPRWGREHGAGMLRLLDGDPFGRVRDAKGTVALCDVRLLAPVTHILAATCLNDVTARELQDKDVQYTRAKGFDTFCPVGPCLATGLDYGNLRVTGRVNGAVRQESTTAQLIFDAGQLVWAVSRVMTLHPGDIISTGTPSGIGPLRPGDVVEVEVEGIGVLTNPVGTRTRAEER